MMRKADGYRFVNISAFIPRLWMVLAALAIPFLVICSNYCEALERSGTMGATIAGMLLSATITGYCALTLVLKIRRI
jgi:uncharacterized membrane protein